MRVFYYQYHVSNGLLLIVYSSYRYNECLDSSAFVYIIMQAEINKRYICLIKTQHKNLVNEALMTWRQLSLGEHCLLCWLCLLLLL